MQSPPDLACTMAPSNGSSKARKTGPSKQPLKPVVPALPLPYVKRQAAAAAAASTRPQPLEPTTGTPDTNGIVQEELKKTAHRSPVSVSGTKHEAESLLGDGNQSADSSARPDGQTNGFVPTGRLLPLGLATPMTSCLLTAPGFLAAAAAGKSGPSGASCCC